MFLPGRCPTTYRDIDLHDQVYGFWKQIYTEVYSKSAHLESLNPDNFLSQDLVLAIRKEDEIVGCIFMKFQNMRSKALLDCSYLNDYTSAALQDLRYRGRDKLMTMEYLTVCPHWRKSVSGLPLASVLLGLAIKVLVLSDAQLLIGTPRVDVKVNRILDEYGFENLGDISKSNYPCQMRLIERFAVVNHPEKEVCNLIEAIWQARRETFRLANLHYSPFNTYKESSYERTANR